MNRVLAAISALKWVLYIYVVKSLTIHTKVDHSAAFWEIVGWFGDVKIEELNGLNINRLDNILTLNLLARRFFDDLALWFEEVPVSLFFPIFPFGNG